MKWFVDSVAVTGVFLPLERSPAKDNEPYLPGFLEVFLPPPLPRSEPRKRPSGPGTAQPRGPGKFRDTTGPSTPHCGTPRRAPTSPHCDAPVPGTPDAGGYPLGGNPDRREHPTKPLAGALLATQRLWAEPSHHDKVAHRREGKRKGRSKLPHNTKSTQRPVHLPGMTLTGEGPAEGAFRP